MMQRMANKFARELGNADAGLGLPLRFGSELGRVVLEFAKRNQMALTQDEVNAAMTAYSAEHAHILRVIARANPDEILDPAKGPRFAIVDDGSFQCSTCEVDVRA